MFDDHDDLIARVAAELKEPVPVDRGLPARVLAGIAARRTRVVPRLAAAAVLAGVGLLGAYLLGRGVAGTDRPVEIQFLYVDPGASSVTLVGDFNDWDPGATPLVRGPGGGLWTVTVPLAPGRYHYSFVVDGGRWTRDPAAPRALGEDFGRPSSALTVGQVESE